MMDLGLSAGHFIYQPTLCLHWAGQGGTAAGPFLPRGVPNFTLLAVNAPPPAPLLRALKPLCPPPPA